jgi:hypothetical protein
VTVALGYLLVLGQSPRAGSLGEPSALGRVFHQNAKAGGQ